MNATDEELSQVSLAALAPLNDALPVPYGPRDLKPARIKEITTYREYLELRESLDPLLKEEQTALNDYLKALESETNARKYLSVKRALDAFFPYQSQRLFIIFVSQKVHQGEAKEALTLLEKSKHFINDFLKRPVTLIEANLALAALRTNAIFSASLKEEKVVLHSPASLKESFQVALPVSTILDQCIRSELQRTLTIFKDERAAALLGYFSLGSDWGNQVGAWVAAALFRRNQTLNLYTKAFTEVNMASCPQTSKLEDCSTTFKSEAFLNSPWNMIVNPAGRNLVRYFLPSLQGQKNKLERIVAQVDEAASTL